jgi:RNA 3'-terminal phosphate cyclase (ATP)
VISIDGSRGEGGEGGGQVLRTSLALSLVTRAPLRITNIRANRKKPGLMRQHLTCVEAARAVSNAEVTGASIGSREIEFRPGETTGGDYSFAVGTAGSATLVFQTVLPALLTAAHPSRLFLEGGTHNPLSPPFDFLERVFLPLVRRAGPAVEVVLERPGFYPAGGGRFRAHIGPSALRGFDLLERGASRSTRARALYARMPRSIAERELRVIADRLRWTDIAIEELRNSLGPGNALLLEIESEHAREIASSFAERGVSAETVANRAAGEVEAYLEADVPVGIHLADQLLLLLALAGGGAFRTLEPTLHSTTQAALLAELLPVEATFERESERVWLARVRPR